MGFVGGSHRGEVMQSFSTLSALELHIAGHHSNGAQLSAYSEEHTTALSTESFVQQVRYMALGLDALGVKQGDRIGVLITSSPKWLVVDLAIMSIGAISLPFFPTMPKEPFEEQLKEWEPAYIFLDVGMGYNSVWLPPIISVSDSNYQLQAEASYEQLLAQGKECSEENPCRYRELTERVRGRDTATVISSLNGEGATLTHEHFMTQIVALQKRFPLVPGKDRSASIISPANMLERFLLYHYLYQGVSIYFLKEKKELHSLFTNKSITVSHVFPRTLAKLHKAHQKRKTRPSALKRFFNWITRSCFSKQKSQSMLGESMRYILTEGERLQAAIYDTCQQEGAEIYHLYSEVETASIIASNYPGYNREGAMGLPFPGMEVALSHSGEVIARSAILRERYYTREQKERGTLDQNGWLHTGKQGNIDGDGYLFLNPVDQRLLHLASGQEVDATKLEKELEAIPMVDRVLIVAEGKPFVSCLLFFVSDTLDTDRPIEEIITDHIRTINGPLPKHMQVRDYRMLSASSLRAEEGAIMQDDTICYEKVEEDFHSLIHSIYSTE